MQIAHKTLACDIPSKCKQLQIPLIACHSDPISMLLTLLHEVDTLFSEKNFSIQAGNFESIHYVHVCHI